MDRIAEDSRASEEHRGLDAPEESGVARIGMSPRTTTYVGKNPRKTHLESPWRWS